MSLRGWERTTAGEHHNSDTRGRRSSDAVVVVLAAQDCFRWDKIPPQRSVYEWVCWQGSGKSEPPSWASLFNYSAGHWSFSPSSVFLIQEFRVPDPESHSLYVSQGHIHWLCLAKLPNETTPYGIPHPNGFPSCSHADSQRHKTFRLAPLPSGHAGTATSPANIPRSPPWSFPGSSNCRAFTDERQVNSSSCSLSY